MPSRPPTFEALAERVCAGLFFVWLLWLPLPFGSNIDAAQRPLILAPLVLCAITAALRWKRGEPISVSRPMKIWTVGALLLLAVVLLQLLPLPSGLLAAVSPESDTIWQGADRITSLGFYQPAKFHPISIHPDATARELYRLAALLATFVSAALLIRNGARRRGIAIVLCIAALFETLYGIREAALQRYAIWGWKNWLMYDRVTGTFVNPNHFAHYVAIILPLAAFVVATAWHESLPGAPLGRRFARVVERQFAPFAAGALAVIACVAAILVSGSRGALAAAALGTLVVGAAIATRGGSGPVSRRTPLKLLLVAVVAVAGVATLAMLLGSDRTVLRRLKPLPGEEATFVGRRNGIEAAFGVWLRFPIAGSGAGTFNDVVSMTQRGNLDLIFHHAHDDYAELAATTGTLGFMTAFVSLLGGCAALARSSFAPNARREMSFSRRAFQIAALTSLAIAMTHALFDFNFFIPSNAATLAAICGAAVAPRTITWRSERAVSADSA